MSKWALYNHKWASPPKRCWGRTIMSHRALWSLKKIWSNSHSSLITLMRTILTLLYCAACPLWKQRRMNSYRFFIQFSSWCEMNAFTEDIFRLLVNVFFCFVLFCVWFNKTNHLHFTMANKLCDGMFYDLFYFFQWWISVKMLCSSLCPYPLHASSCHCLVFPVLFV